jgi:hypothetical protein
MNLEKLKDLESEFLYEYPKALENERLIKLMKKFNPEKLEQLSKELFKKENFSQPELICEGFVKVVYKSVVISFYDKMKLRDVFKEMSAYQKDMFSIALYDLLYEDKKEGYENIVEVLAKYNLAKWTLISLVPYYMDRANEYFIKPTTAKNIISYLELENLSYKPKPTYEFYMEYKKALDEVKSKVNKSLKNENDNIYMTAFLRIAIQICEID